ncbi:MAG: helix-turn-helix domain-containing protein [Candidatus Pacearchaeota archaeon]
MEEQIENGLKSIGLNKSEIDVYLDLLKSGISTALEISRRTKIYRPNTYEALRRLNDKGFVKELMIGERRAFQALEPEKIIDYIKQKEKEIQLIIPRIKAFTKTVSQKESISIARGIFALKDAYLRLLKLNKPIDSYSIPTKAVEIMGEGCIKFKEFHKERIKNKISMRHIYSKNNPKILKKLNKIKYLEARHLARRYDHLVCTTVCGDSVVIAIFSNPISVIEIKNKEIADSYHKYFETLWNNASK